MKQFSPKKLTFCAMLLCLLFVQEEILTVLPNIQLTVLLITIYGAVLGPFYGSLIVLCHVVLDNMVMGSLNPIVIVPMLLGWETVLLFGWMTKKSPLPFVIIFGVLGSLLYCWFFAVTNALCLHIQMSYYLLSDVPFEIILCVCSAITIMFLYRPTVSLMRKYWEKT